MDKSKLPLWEWHGAGRDCFLSGYNEDEIWVGPDWWKCTECGREAPNTVVDMHGETWYRTWVTRNGQKLHRIYRLEQGGYGELCGPVEEMDNG